MPFTRKSSVGGASRRKQIKKLLRRDETIVRLDAFGSIYAMTWVAGDSQLLMVADGFDHKDPPTRAFHSCIFRITGDPPAPAIEELPGYPHMRMKSARESEHASFWATGCLS